MGALLYASEAWILSILGWSWLTLQEIWGFSLLNAYVFYGMLFLSTCHVILIACFPGMRALKTGYLSAVLVLLITSLGYIFDTLETPVFGSNRFELSLALGKNGTNCSLAQVNRAFYFNSSSALYLGQAGVILGYLVVHLFIAAAGMVEATSPAVAGDSSSSPSVWPGPAWGLALVALVSFRYFIMFEGSIKGIVTSSVVQRDILRKFRYLHLFSEPMWEFTSGFLVFFELALVLLALEGFPMPNLGQRKFVRFFVMGFTPLFVICACVALSFRGMLTLPALLTLLATLPPALAGTVEAALAKRPAPATPVAPSAPPEHLMTGRSIYNRPGARSHRNYIPVPVEMIGEKSKAV